MTLSTTTERGLLQALAHEDDAGHRRLVMAMLEVDGWRFEEPEPGHTIVAQQVVDVRDDPDGTDQIVITLPPAGGFHVLARPRTPSRHRRWHPSQPWPSRAIRDDARVRSQPMVDRHLRW